VISGDEAKPLSGKGNTQTTATELRLQVSLVCTERLQSTAELCSDETKHSERNVKLRLGHFFQELANEKQKG
jgi:hypothetical protein